MITDCKSAGNAFGGSDPPSPRSKQHTARRCVVCFGMGFWKVDEKGTFSSLLGPPAGGRIHFAYKKHSFFDRNCAFVYV